MVAVSRSKDSHAFANMVEHIFLAEIMQEMWVSKGEVLEVAKRKSILGVTMSFWPRAI